MRTKEKKIKEKQKGKRQISVITVMMFVFLVFVMSTITVNSIKENLMYEDSELAKFELTLQASTSGSLTINDVIEEMDSQIKDLNIYVRNRYDINEEYKLTFLERKEASWGRVTYVFQSDKTNAELKDFYYYVEVKDMEYLSIKDQIYSAYDTWYNTKTNNWERNYYTKSSNTLYCSEKTGSYKEVKVNFSNVPNNTVPKELYENIIIDRSYVFDRIENGEYIYKGIAVNDVINSVYIPNIIENKIDSSKVSSVKFNKLYSSLSKNYDYFRYFESEYIGNYYKTSSVDIMYTDTKTSISKEFNWKSDTSAEGELKFKYSSRNREYNVNEIISSCYYSSNRTDTNFNFLIYEEKLPSNFKIPDYYLSYSEWTFLDSVSSDYARYNVNIQEDTLKVPNDVIQSLLYLGNNGITYTGKRYVYVKSTNTVYALVNNLNLGNSDSNYVGITVQYTGNDLTNREYLPNESGMHAWHVFADKYKTNCSIYSGILCKELEVKNCNVAVEKKWEDEDNKYSIRPDSITVSLKANDEVKKTVNLNSVNNWKTVFECLPIVDSSGDEITYTVEETKNAFYKSNITSEENANKTTFVITNSVTVPDDEIEVIGQKVWEDENNKFGKRPESITLELKNKNGEVIETGVANAENNWSYKFSAPKYNEDLTEAEYTIDEESTGSIYYEKVGNDDNYTVVNKFRIPEEKTSKNLEKIWEDEDNKYSKRPESITFELYGNDKLVDIYVLTDTSKSEIIHTFENLAKYDEVGEIEYKVVEKKSDEVEWYDEEISYEDNTFKVTNKFKVPDVKISKTVTKIWDDESNKNGKRPESVTFELYGNDKLVDTYVLSDTSEDEVTYTFENLPKYDESGEIEYRVEEKYEANEFYVSNQVGDEITNKFVIPEDKLTIIATKVWDDNNNEALKRDKGVTLQLKVEDAVVAEGYVNEENNWTYKFEVEKYDENAKEITYELDEKEIENMYYERVEVENKDMLNQKLVNKFVVPDEKVKITVNKRWSDENDKYSKRPSKVVVQLLANEKVVKNVTVNEENNWSYTFEMPKYDKYGNEIEYSVDEKTNLKYYEKKIEGYNIINTCVYNEVVDTSDMNIYIYIGVFAGAVIGIAGVIFFQIKRKENKMK